MLEGPLFIVLAVAIGVAAVGGIVCMLWEHATGYSARSQLSKKRQSPSD